MKIGVWSSDFHLGLQTDEVDRTDEIVEVMLFIARHAIKVKADFVVLGGDIFDHNTPNEALIARFIEVLNILKNIIVYVMVGNHDVIAKDKRRSCLSFIRKLKKGGYPNLRLMDDIKTIKWAKAEVGDVYFTFLPFITKAHLKPAYKSVQQYIDVQAKMIQKKMPEHTQHFVFSHLMPPDCVPGSEDNMLKKVDVMVPKVFLEWKLGKNRPIVINGHVHTRQEKDNLHVIGSPVFTGFGEKEKKKYFLQINIPEFMGEGPGGLKYIKTPCLKFKEFDMHIKSPQDVFLIPKFNKNTIVKVNAVVEESGVGFDFAVVRKSLARGGAYVKPIKPIIIRKRVKRNKGQTVKLAPQDAIRMWLKAHKPKNKKKLFGMAKDYIEQVLS